MHFFTLLALPCALALPTIVTRQEPCTGDAVTACTDGPDGTWSRCSNDVVTPMGPYGSGWTCDSLRQAYGMQKRDAIPSILAARQGCSGDSVPECDDTAKTWSRCAEGVITPMGTFGDSWSCDALRQAYPGK